MTEEHKELLIAKMLDAPASLSDKELEAIVSDAELRDIYEISAAASRAYIRQPQVDVDKEWADFRKRIHRPRPAMRWIMRVAAVFLGIIVCGIIVKLTTKTVMPDETPAAVTAQTVPSVVEEPPSRPDLKVEETVPGPTRKTAPAPATRKKAVRAKTMLAKTQPETANKEIDNTDEIDVEEYIRIQQAKVDNNLALQEAEIYAERRLVMARLLDAIDGDGESEINNARKTIMQ